MSLRDMDLVAWLSQAHVDLMRARDETAVVRAVLAAVQPFAPDAVDLAYVHPGPRGATELEVICLSDGGKVRETSPLYGIRYELAPDNIAMRWVGADTEPHVFVDVRDEPDLMLTLNNLGRTPGSAVVLPLYSERHASWQGVTALYWERRHVPSEDELRLYRVLLRLIAEAIAGERTLKALHAALRDNQGLLAETQRVLHETRAQRETLRVMLDHLPVGVEVLNLATDERELINRAGKEMLGEGGASDRIGVVADSVYRPGSSTPVRREELPFARVTATGETAREEYEVARGDGERPRFELTVAQLVYPEDPAPRVILLYQDVTAARRADHERLRAQEELLRVQAAALAERSTPLIPLTEDVLVMPLIGALDPERGRQVLETLVHLGGQARVRAAIVDVTGVTNLDEAAASALIDAARALRLRGVQPVLTGIQPAVAATLVELGVDLSGIAVRGTLQDGVRWATRR